MSPSPKGVLRLRAGPYLSSGVTTPRLMLDVLLALAPLVVAAIWLFGLGALMVLGVTTLGAMATEWLFLRERADLRDGSAALTGLLLGLTLPPTVPLWIALVGAVVAIGLGKLVWGGLGQNLFNPALVGRAFVQAAFPSALTTWVAPNQGLLAVSPAHFAAPLMHPGVDVVTMATPLARMKFEFLATDLSSLLLGNTGGCLGETSALLIALGGAYLLIRRTFDWRIPVATLGMVAAGSAALYLADTTRYPSPWFMLASGGLMFGAVFMATDPVTSPTAPKASWAFGAGIGALVVLIRVFGGLPEGVMYSILLMNAAAPLLERYAQPRPFGRKRGP